MGRGKSLAVNTIIIGIGKISTQLISFFLLPLYTAVLTTEEYGIYDLIMTVTTFLMPCITLLMEESMFRFLIDCKNEKDKKIVISQTFIYSTMSTIIFLALIIVVGKIFNIENITLIISYLISLIVVSVKNAILRGIGKISLFSISNFVSSLVMIILNIYFILKLNMGYAGLIYSGIIANLIISILVLLKVKIWKLVSFKCINRKKMKEMLKYSIPLVPNSLSWAVINLSDRLVISNVLGISANGIYSMANKFPNIIDTVYGFFYTAWKESAAKVLDDEDKEIFYNNIYDILKRFLISITIGLIAFLPFIFNFLIKNDFLQAYIYIPILLFAMYYSNISGYYGGIFSAYKNTKIMGYTTIISAILNLVINIVFIKFIGIWAAAISTLFSTYIVYKLRKNKIKKYVKLKENYSLVLGIVVIFNLFAYYMHNSVLKLINCIIVLIYCMYINKNIIIECFDKVNKKWKNINAK